MTHLCDIPGEANLIVTENRWVVARRSEQEEGSGIDNKGSGEISEVMNSCLS